MSLDQSTPPKASRMNPEATRAALIEAIVLNVFSNDHRLNTYGPYDRQIHMEDLRDTIKVAIGDWIGENGDVHDY